MGALETNDDSGRESLVQETCQQQEEIYAPISVIHGEVRNSLIKVFRNVGLFIQVSVRAFDWTNARKALDTSETHLNFELGHNALEQKKGSRFPGSLWLKLVCVRR